MQFSPKVRLTRLLTLSLLLCGPALWSGCVVTSSDAKDAGPVDTGDEDVEQADEFEEPPPQIKPILKVDKPVGPVQHHVVFTLDIGDLDPADFTFHWEWGDGDERDSSWSEGMDAKSLLTEEYTYIYKGDYAAKVTVAWRKNLKIKGDALLNISVIQPSELTFSKPVQLISSEVVGLGDAVTLTFEITNEGDEVVLPFETGVYLSKDATLDKNDLLVHTIAHEGMGSGLTGVAVLTYDQDNPVTFNLPGTVADGHYWIFVHLDRGEVVGEFNDLDNIQFASSLLEVNSKVAAKPDLTVTAPVISSGATSYSPGEAVTYELNIKNLGDGEAKNFKFSVFLSKDKKLDYAPGVPPSEIDLNKFDLPVTDAATTTVKNLKGLASLPIFKAMSVPNVSDETFYLIAKIDTDDNVIETNEGNNVAVSDSTITIKKVIKQGVDLALLDMDVQPTGTYLGGSINVVYTVKNLGTLKTPSFPVTIFFCPNNALSKTICIMNQTKFTIDPLAVGQELKGTQKIEIAKSTPVQNWYIFMQLDPDNTIAELNKGNNIQKFATLLVTATANVDLVAENIAYHPTSVKAGEVIKLSYKLLNKGTSGSGATKTAIAVSQSNQFSAANLASGANTLLAMYDEAPINPLATAYRGAKVVVPLGLDHTKKEWFVGVILDVNGDEKAESANDKLNNGAPAKTKLIVEEAKGGCYEDKHDLEGKDNDKQANAATIGVGVTAGLALCQNEDWYAVQVDKGHSLFVTIKSTPVLWTSPIAADLDIDLLAPSGKLLDSVKSLGLAKKAAALTVPETGAYLVRVYPHTPGVQAHYDIDVTVQGPPKGVDLYGGAMTVGPAATFPGGLLKTKLALTNLGDQASKAFVVRYLLSTDPKIDDTDTKLLDVPFEQGLGAAQSLEFNRNLVLPVVAGGKYYVGAIIDAKGEIAETDEKNNTVTSNSVQLNSKITCATDSFSGNHTADDAAALEPTPKKYDKLNVCPGLEDWFVVDVAQGKALTVKVLWKQVSGNGLIGMQVVDSSKTGVLVGSANPQDTSAKLPYTQSAGKYYVHIYVLPEGGKPAQPYDYELDLAVTEPDPTDVCLPDSYEGTSGNNSHQTAQELGCGFANLSLCMGDQDWFYLDMAKDEKVILDFKHPGNSFKFNIFSNPNLKPLQTIAGSGVLNFVAPDNGKYFMQVAHKEEAVKPAQGFAYTLKVDGGKGIDLLPVLKSVFPTTAAQNDDVYVTSVFSNECKTDAAAFHYGYYLSKDTTLDKDDSKLLSKKVDGGMSGKTSKEFDDALIVPELTKPGPYFLFVKVDDQEEVTESQELNNTDYKATTITKLCLPDALEPNGTPTTATPITPGKLPDLSLCPYEYDWYAFTAKQGETITVSMEFDKNEGDLNMRLFEVGKWASPVATAATKESPEQLVFVAPKTTKYYLRVNGFIDASAAYTLFLCQKVGGSCYECTGNAECKAKPGDFCNPAGKCESLNCTVGDDATCDDGNACTQRQCLINVGCKTTVLSGGSCADGDACTLGESCDAQGICVAPLQQVIKDAKGQIAGQGGEMVRLGAGRTLYAGAAVTKGGNLAGRLELHQYAQMLWGAVILPQGATSVMLYGAATRTDAGEVVAVGAAEMLPQKAFRGLFTRVHGKTGAILTTALPGDASFAERLYDVIPAETGQFVVVGQTPLASKSTGRDGLIAALDDSGKVVWTHSVGGASDDALMAVARAADGTLLAAGVDVDDKGAEQGVIVGLDKTGKELWKPVFPLVAPGVQSRFEAITLGADGNYAVGGGSDLGQTGVSPVAHQALILWLTAKSFAAQPSMKGSLIIPATTPQDAKYAGTKISLVRDLQFGSGGALIAVGHTGAATTAVGLTDGAVWTVDASQKLGKTFPFGGAGHDDLRSVWVKSGQVLAFGSSDIGAASGPRWYQVEVTPPKADCNDGNICTTDGCNAKTGCSHEPLPDGEACGIGVSCKAGVCQ